MKQCSAKRMGEGKQGCAGAGMDGAGIPGLRCPGHPCADCWDPGSSPDTLICLQLGRAHRSRHSRHLAELAWVRDTGQAGSPGFFNGHFGVPSPWSAWGFLTPRPGLTVP